MGVDEQMSLFSPPPDPDEPRRQARRAEPPLVRRVRGVIADELAREIVRAAEAAAVDEPPR